MLYTNACFFADDISLFFLRQFTFVKIRKEKNRVMESRGTKG